ncbi:MAG: hypothetical protein R6V58_03745 [Planctomycetota bacterium]
MRRLSEHVVLAVFAVLLAAVGCQEPQRIKMVKTADERAPEPAPSAEKDRSVPLSMGGSKAGPVRFTRLPTVTRDGDAVRIEFAVDRPTDAAVYVEDSEGEVVRHLAAGVLGDNAPAPLQKNSLAQSVVWDRKDDQGQPLPNGRYRVRVAAGLSPAYAGNAFSEYTGPDHVTHQVMGLAAGPDGRVYALTRSWHSGHWRASTVHVFRRNGEYEKTIKPFPASTPPERLEGIDVYRTDDGRALPVVHRVLAMSFYPWEDIEQQIAVTPDGVLRMVVVEAGYRKKPEHYLVGLDGRDGAPTARPLAAKLFKRSDAADVNLAAASDGKSVYLTGINSHAAAVRSRTNNVPCVYRVDLADRRPKPFFGDPDKPGSDRTHLNNPQGLATTGSDQLLVADRGNNRVVIISEKDGRLKGQIGVPDPTWVGVHHETGALYVASRGHVVKFDPHGKELARMTLPELPERYRKRTRWFFALDAATDPAVLWIGNTYAGSPLLRVVDKGAAFSAPEPAGYEKSIRLWNVSVGLENREVACKVGWRPLHILNERTGKIVRRLRPHGSAGQTYRLGPNGQVYGMDHWRHGIRRWDRNGKYLPFPATKDDPTLKGRLRSVPSGTTSWERDFSVDHDGNVYVKDRGKHYHGRMTVDVYDRDGEFKRTALWVVTDGAMGPRLDPAGNLYLAEAIKPVGLRYPVIFDALPAAASQQYTWMYGSVIKFGPPGGAVWFPVRAKVDEYAFDGQPTLPESLATEKVSTIHSGRLIRQPGRLEGALWWRFGCAPVLDMHRSHNERCHCTGSDFDVDDFGRVFYPDQGRFRIVVLDTAGNEILTFGSYGNQDSCGPQSYVVDPAGGFLRPRRKDDPAALGSPFGGPKVPIAWVIGLAVSDRYAYIADGLNRRVLRARLGYQAEATCDVP